MAATDFGCRTGLLREPGPPSRRPPRRANTRRCTSQHMQRGARTVVAQPDISLVPSTKVSPTSEAWPDASHVLPPSPGSVSVTNRARFSNVASSISSGCRRIRLVGSSLIRIGPHAAATQNAWVIMPRTYGSRAFGLRRGTPKRQAGYGTHPGGARRAGRPQRAWHSRSGTRRAAIPSSRNTAATARRIVRTK